MTDARTEMLKAVCWFAGGIYNGLQETPKGCYLIVTEPQTKSTGAVRLDAEFTTSRVLAKMQEIRLGTYRP